MRFHPGRVEEGDKFFLCLLLGLLAESADVEHHRLILAYFSHLPVVYCEDLAVVGHSGPVEVGLVGRAVGITHDGFHLLCCGLDGDAVETRTGRVNVFADFHLVSPCFFSRLGWVFSMNLDKQSECVLKGHEVEYAGHIGLSRDLLGEGDDFVGRLSRQLVGSEGAVLVALLVE